MPVPSWEQWEHSRKITDAGVNKTNFYSNPFSNNCCVTLGKMLNFSETTLSHTVIVLSKIAYLLTLCNIHLFSFFKALVTVCDSLLYVLLLSNYYLSCFEDVPAHSIKFKSYKGYIAMKKESLFHLWLPAHQFLSLEKNTVDFLCSLPDITYS